MFLFFRSIFELSTQLLPDYFLLLASLGNFIKVLTICIQIFFFGERDKISSLFLQATARGLKDPSFRVIQNHFSVSNNLGEIASKVHSFIELS